MHAEQVLAPQSESRRLLMQEGVDGFVAMLEGRRAERIAEALGQIEAGDAVEVLDRLPEPTSIAVTEHLDHRLLWRLTNARLYPAGSVGRLMTTPKVCVRPDDTVGRVLESVRSLGSGAKVLLVWVAERGGKLVGTLHLHDALVSPPETRVQEAMDASPRTVLATTRLDSIGLAGLEQLETIYGVVDEAGRLVGVLRADQLLRGMILELAAKPGEMQGVRSEERLSTPVSISMRSRVPWLTINLMTCFLPAAVVGLFQGTVEKHVLLAAFLPVMIGQAINAGGQSLAVMVRTMTIGEVEPERMWRSVAKELKLGLIGGGVTGVLAAAAMWLAVSFSGGHDAGALAVSTLIGMLGACAIGCATGTAVPWVIRRMGYDPAMSSHLVLTTCTDVAAVLLLLGAAALLA